MENLELIVHPVRLRVIHALTGSGPLTTGDIASRLPNVSKATVYRQVAILVDAGVLQIASERRVRGTVERRFGLTSARTSVGAGAAASLSLMEHRRVFATAMAILLAEFDGYLDSGHADPVADQVGYRQHSVWLTDDERNRLIEGMRSAIVPALGNEEAAGRRRHLLSPVLFPAG
jgi:hypothetical protein